MKFVSGDICFILENNKYATRVKVMGRQADEYIVQRIGSCGAMKLPENKLFATEEQALASRKTTRAMVSPQLSITPDTDRFTRIPGDGE
jgi:hypothetical protein